MPTTLTRLALLSILVAPACATAELPMHTLPTTYTCDQANLTDDGQLLGVRNADRQAPANVQLGWEDKQGRHYVNWPTAVTDKESVEYVVPDDARADVVVNRYDTRQGTAKQDWLLLNTSTCRARGGYSDALARFASGESMGEIQKALSLGDKSQARQLVYDAMIKLQRRYFKDQ